MTRTNTVLTRTLRLKVKREGCAWLDAAAREVNTVWNWANDTSAKAVRRFAGAPKWLTGFDLCSLSAGATECFAHIGADTIQRINGEYATKRRAAKRAKLRWRKSGGSKRSLGWVPFKAASIKRKGRAIRFCGKTFRVFEAALLEGATWRDGCFAQDAVGDWWLCLPVAIETTDVQAPRDRVGIDLGLKDTATTSDGDKLEAGRFYRGIEAKLAQAQRRAHKKQAKRLHRKAARQRKDALHQFSRRIVNQYQHIVVGDVSSRRLARTRVQGPAGQALRRNRQRSEHNASLQRLRCPHGAGRPDRTRCKGLALLGVWCRARPRHQCRAEHRQARVEVSDLRQRERAPSCRAAEPDIPVDARHGSARQEGGMSTGLPNARILQATSDSRCAS